jgi:hypothetical protein
MPIPENFKYDVRVRERMLKRGLLTEGELAKHIEAAADVTDLLVEVELKQPALMKESERVERVVSRTPPRPVSHVPVIRSLENELNDIDEDDDLDDLDDEDDDEDEIKVKAAAKTAAAAAAAEKAKAEPAPAPEEPAPAAAPADEGTESEQ